MPFVCLRPTAKTKTPVEFYKNNTPIGDSRTGTQRRSLLQIIVDGGRTGKKHGMRLHILHISTGDETSLFEVGAYGDSTVAISEKRKKRITSEACVHHLWFDSELSVVERPEDNLTLHESFHFHDVNIVFLRKTAPFQKTTVLLRLERKNNDTTFHLETYFEKPKLDTDLVRVLTVLGERKTMYLREP